MVRCKSSVIPRKPAHQLNKQMFTHSPKLYFVKVDVKSAFDSIDQDKLLGVLEEILRNDTAGDYVTTRYSQVLPPTGRAPLLWNKRAVPRNEISRFDDVAEGFAHGLSNAIFIDQVDQTIEERGKVLLTLRQHIKSNLIKVGRDFYSQKVGIPQGSKVSSLLCSFFYGHLERENLAFVKSEESVSLASFWSIARSDTDLDSYS